VKIRKNDDLLGLASIEVIGSLGETLGVMPPAEGLRLARESGVDIVEVNPKTNPPLCKLLDFQRFKYDELKKAARARHGPAPLVFLVRSKVAVGSGLERTSWGT
jgi:translation initiation factor IF-3